jgi:hypothetical protein
MIPEYNLRIIGPPVCLLPLTNDVRDVQHGILVDALSGQSVALFDFIARKSAIPNADLESVPNGVIVGCPGA